MKILHFADLHLGVETHGKIDPATGLNTRFIDFIAALDRLIDYAIDSRVDLVLFCGDAYKNREPSQTQQREFAKRIRKLSQSGITVFLLVGNHDLPNAMGRATSTEIFDTLAVNNVYVSGKPDVYRVQTKNGLIQIASLPWLRRSALLGREETKELDADELKHKLEETLTRIVLSLAEKVDPYLPSILAAHVYIVGSQLGSERSMSLGMEHGLLLGTVANPAFDYVALGHIHKQQVLNANPPVVYSGSMERVDFGEEDDDKGFYEIDIFVDPVTHQKLVKYEFKKLEGRRFITIEVQLKPGEVNPAASIVQAIAAQSIKDAIVRLLITAPAQGSGISNEAEIRAVLKESHHFTIAFEREREKRMKIGDLPVEELTPIEALKRHLELKNISPDRAKILVEYGEKLIDKDN
jgi:DNA repair protein SbcD/Mre11